MSFVQKNCAACDALISVRLADHKRGWGKFCDKACKAAFSYGHRPRDVNADHAKSSPWAKTCMAVREAMGVTQWPRAARIKDQVGNVKVKPIYYSPCDCKRCGQKTDGPGLCDSCWIDDEGLMSLEAGWDGHKVWGAGA